VSKISHYTSINFTIYGEKKQGKLIKYFIVFEGCP